MDRKLFFEQVKYAREWDNRPGFHRVLDDLIENVTSIAKGGKMSEQSLEEDVKRVIKRIKKAKEDEKLTQKAREWIKQIGDSLEGPSE